MLTRPSQANTLGSDLELAYASPSGPHGRKRRCRGYSDDEGHLTADGFTNEDLRVGGPYLFSLPARNIHITKEHPLYSRLHGIDSQVFSDVLSILRSSPIVLKSLGFIARQSRWVPEAPVIVTAFVIARREAIDDGWLDTARKIWEYLVSQGLPDVCVEIADKRALKEDRVFPVRIDDAISTKWTVVRSQILRSIDLTDVFLVGCYRVGQSDEGNENPPTVLVLVNVHSSRDWKDAREAIVGILDQHDLPMVAVQISKDRLCCADGVVGDLDRAACQGLVKPGYSIGNQADGAAAATFGGYIDLQSPCTGRWLKFGLTSVDCVAQEENRGLYSDWWQNDVSIKHDLAKHHFCLYSPIPRDLEEKLRELEKELEDVRSSESYKTGKEMEADGLIEMMPKTDRETFLIAKSSIADMESFAKEIRAFQENNRHQFGHVAAASGPTCKPEILKNMNWVLIDVDKSREGPNEFGNGYPLRMASSNTLIDLSDRLLHIESRSSPRRGVYTALKPALIMEKMVNGVRTRRETIEHTATGYRSELFTRHGDSGSLVFQGTGEVVGMVFARCEQKGITLFTRIDDLFGDIKQHTGATGVRFSED